MTEIINPLYAGKNVKEVALARNDNAEVGVCPKCGRAFSRARLGAKGGGQEVFFCDVDRVSFPIPNQ